MDTAIKIGLTLGIILLLGYPFIPAKGKLRPFFVASGLKYHSPDNRMNAVFVPVSMLEIALFAVLFKFFDRLATTLYGIPFIGDLLKGAVSHTSSRLDYVVFAIKLVLVNLLAIYAYIIVKAIIKKFLIDFPVRVAEVGLFRAIFGNKRRRRRRKKKNGDGNLDAEDPTEIKEEDEEERKKRRKLRVPFFEHTEVADANELDRRQKEKEKESAVEKVETQEEKPKYNKFKRWLLSLFFEGDSFEYAKGWVVRSRCILQTFIRIIQFVYLAFFIVVILSAFFKLPTSLYNFLIDGLKVGDWYLYPFLSLILLQEICNVFDAPFVEIKTREENKEEADKLDNLERNARVRKLLAEIKKRFDKEHYLRYYPETEPDEVPEYECTSVMYKSALEYIKNHMSKTSGHVVQSYMRFLDAVYNDDHTYFAASFYSEIGEYLIAYTYIRLLSGARQVFVVSNPDEKETLRTYISDRLMKMTGSSPMSNWRVYTADERLEQADILIASAEDFVNSDIVEEHPAFFEEVCNAIFIDADRLVSLNSYLCPVVATRLQNATNGRIKFIFLTLDLVKGFAEGSIPRFFCIDKVLSFSSAKENEAVSCVLWNKESKKHRLYNKSIQKPACLETIIAEQACDHGIDGVRLITESALENAERKILSLHNVEINNFYKDIVDVNYMVYSDDRCNLSAALYATTRFRGRKKSVVHIISKPYLLREYFMAKAISEEHINRSSFIQPRVTEHYERHRLSLVRLFCDTASEEGILVSEFERRVKELIVATKERNDIVSSAFCRNIIALDDLSELKLNDYVAYLVAGIYDDDAYVGEDDDKIRAKHSRGHDAKNFYIVVDSTRYGELAATSKRYIVFTKVKEVFAHLIECNKRVDVILNDDVIGKLDTFPSRVHLEYIEGQSVIFNNSEFEIDHIADDGSAVYLRHENINIKNCLDTVILRHYNIHDITPVGESAVLNNSQSMLSEIRVSRGNAKLSATSFGFFSLTGDRQTLDFYRGVEGNLNYDNPKVREYSDARILHITLTSRNQCTDGMRRLLAAVFNEFIKTLFPGAYHCVAIVPVLAEGEILDPNDKNGDPLERIKKLYPFFNDPTEDYVEKSENKIQLYVINDSTEDVGILDWFYDHSARYMQEFLANIYSYLHWLMQRPKQNHYIYFGGKELPECYDLEGLCELLGELNLILSDSGEIDIETAGDDVVDEKLETCAFCHKLAESGRYSLFDDHRIICAECFDIVSDKKRLEEIYLKVKNYLEEKYPGLNFSSPNVDFDSTYDLTADQTLSENYYRIDFATKTIYVEIDQPANNVAVSILRGLITFWQVANELANHYSSAQLYFEELQYLRGIGENESADWIYNKLSDQLRANVDEIEKFVKGEKNDPEGEDPEGDDPDGDDPSGDEPDGDGESDPEVEDDPTDEETDNCGEGETSEAENGDEIAERNSFTFMVVKAHELEANDWDGTDPVDPEYSNGLYDPNRIPRFFKRYLRGEHIDDGNDEDKTDAELESEEDEEEDPEGNDADTDNDTDEGDADADSELENAPPPTEGELEPIDPSAATDPKEKKRLEKLLAKQEKERKRAEAKRKKAEEEEKKFQAFKEQRAKAVQEKNDRRKALGMAPVGGSNDSDGDDKTKEKKTGIFGNIFKKNKKNVATEDPETKVVGEIPEGNDPIGNNEPENDPDSETPITDVPSTGDANDEPQDEPQDEPKKEKKKKNVKKPNKTRRIGRGKLTEGERIIPYEDDEKTNPKIRLYNEIARAAYNFSTEPILCDGVTSSKEIQRIFTYVLCDYPELFWLKDYDPADGCYGIVLRYCCKDANGNLDVKQINRKRDELRKAAKYFTKGITKRTDPYEALLTIYRRVILSFDYDDIGLENRIDDDTSRDDPLRSLYNALVHHKVVCAGYAAAMQYLLQSVGIVCAYTKSNYIKKGDKRIGHAFNVLKIGKYCYYLDATWGDASSTKAGQEDWKNIVKYEYLCCPYSDFIKTKPGDVIYHTPNKEYYPELEEFKYTNHEYYRYHNAYLKSYNEKELIRIFAETAVRYEKSKENLGDFVVSFRCPDGNVLSFFEQTLASPGKVNSIVASARDSIAKKNKKAAKLLERQRCHPIYHHDTGVAQIIFLTPPSKKNKKDKGEN